MGPASEDVVDDGRELADVAALPPATLRGRPWGERPPPRPPPMPKVVGALTDEEIAEFLGPQRGVMRRCRNGAPGEVYKAAFDDWIVLRFQISTSGQVDEVEIEKTSVKDKSVTACVRSMAEELEFPKPLDGQPVTVTWRLALW